MASLDVFTRNELNLAAAQTVWTYDEAECFYHESLKFFEKLDDCHSIATTQSSLASLLSNRGQYDEAERLYRKSLRVKEALGDTREIAVTKSSLAYLLSATGRDDEAEGPYNSYISTCLAIH